MSKGVNFEWLKKQAANENTKKILSSIKEKKLRENKSYALKLKKYKIFVSKEGALSSLYTYQEQFKNKDHMKVSSFSGKDAKVVLDIGANEGFYTLRTKEINPNCTIIAVEPVPITFKYLKNNISKNKLKNVHLINKAVSSKKDKITIEFVEGLSSLSGANLKKTIKPLFIKKTKTISKEVYEETKEMLKNIKSIKVNTISGDNIFKKYKLKQVDLMKIDVEGNELDVLKSTKNNLNKIDKMVIEFHGKKEDGSDIKPKLKNFLKKYGFKPVLEENGQFGCGDIYFTKQ